MMTIEEILARKECQTFDCKSIQIDPKALAIPIVAMANADGGMLAIGVSDKTRRIEGIDGNEERLNELLRVPFDFCNPSVRVRCEYLPCTDYEGRKEPHPAYTHSCKRSTSYQPSRRMFHACRRQKQETQF